MNLAILNIGLLQTAEGTQPLRGRQQAENRRRRDACVLIRDGRIAAVLQDGEKPERGLLEDCRILDARGALVTAGLVDCHTHLIFGGWRQHELPLKLRGAGYLEILRAGGGILDTVRSTRAESEEALYRKSLAFLREALSFGVTTCEVKSGYGLNLEDELKQLRVARRLGETGPVEVVSTFMGAHAVPDEYRGRADAYLDFLCGTVLPRVAQEELAQFCDVFCEDSVFDVAQSRRVLEAGKALGLRPKIHADEIEEIGGAVLAGEIGAISAEHLIATGESGMKAMAESGVIAALLPQTSLYLGKPYAPARRMIDMGIPVAVASDFNPGSCPSLNLQLSVSLACTKYRMLPEEVLSAVTLNAACAVGRGDRIGTVEPGKQGDLVIWDAPDLEMLCYRFGSNLAGTVVKNGTVVKENA